MSTSSLSPGGERCFFGTRCRKASLRFHRAVPAPTETLRCSPGSVSWIPTWDQVRGRVYGMGWDGVGEAGPGHSSSPSSSCTHCVQSTSYCRLLKAPGRLLVGIVEQPVYLYDGLCCCRSSVVIPAWLYSCCVECSSHVAQLWQAASSTSVTSFPWSCQQSG